MLQPPVYTSGEKKQLMNLDRKTGRSISNENLQNYMYSNHVRNSSNTGDLQGKRSFVMGLCP